MVHQHSGDLYLTDQCLLPTAIWKWRSVSSDAVTKGAVMLLPNLSMAKQGPVALGGITTSSWPCKHFSLLQRPLRPAMSWKNTKAALPGVLYSRHVTALPQERNFPIVPAHSNTARRCQHPLTQQSCHSRGQTQCHRSAASRSNEVALG